jgi:hypothetical protein
MKNYLLKVGDIEHQIQTLMASYPDMASDDELKFDMIEGSTDFLAVMDKIILQARLLEQIAAACGQHASQILERKKKLERRCQFNRDLAHRLMETVGTTSLELPAGKVSVVKSPDKVIITDETDIPDAFMRMKKEPNKTAIKEALKKGEEVTGAMLSNGGSTIQIR